MNYNSTHVNISGFICAIGIVHVLVTVKLLFSIMYYIIFVFFTKKREIIENSR